MHVIRKRVKRLFRETLSAYPNLFSMVYRCIPKYRGTIACQGTDIVIEGYPRSANTFAVASFYAQGNGNMCIARHQHSIAQVLYALKYNIPCIVLIRNPRDAILSYVIRDDLLPMEEAIQRYIDFYAPLLAYKHRFVIGEFNEVISVFGSIINKVNKQYRKSFYTLVSNSNTEREINRLVDQMEKKDSGAEEIRWTHVARPNRERDSLKEARAKELDSYTSLLGQADDIYRQFVECVK